MLALLVATILPSLSADQVAGARLVPQVGHPGFVNQVGFSPTGDRIITASDDGTAGVWDVATGAMLLRLAGHAGGVVAADFVEGATAIRTVSTAGEIITWDSRTGAERSRAETDQRFTSAVILADRVLAVDRENTAAFWTSTGDRGRALSGPVTRVWPSGATSDGRWIAAATSDTTVGIFKGRSGAKRQELTVTSERVTSVALSSDGRQLLTADLTQAVKLWSARGGDLVRALTAADADARQFDTRFGPRGELLTLDTADRLRTFASDGTEVRLVQVEADVQGSLAVSPDGQTFAASGGGAPIPVWGAPDEPQWLLRGQVRLATALAPPQAGMLAVGHDDGQATVWSPYSGGVQNTFEIGRDAVKHVALHNRGLLLATTDRDVALYNPRMGSRFPLFRLQRDAPTQRDAALSFDGSELYVSHAFGAEGYGVDLFRPSFLRKRVEGGFLIGAAEPLGDVSALKARPPFQVLPSWLELGDDGSVRLLDPESGAWRGSLYTFRDGNWAVIDAEGRFDAGDDRALGGLVWVIDGRPYRLSQLRDRYFEPNLLAKLLGHNDEPMRAVPPLSTIEAPPAVHLEGPTPTGSLELRIEDRGNGIGPLWATLNGSDIAAEIESRCPELRNGGPCTVDLSGLPTWLPGESNAVVVEASSGDGVLRSRGLDAVVQAAGEPMKDPPDLWILAIGTGDYAGTDLDLTYAASDALRIGNALRVAGGRGFGAERTHVRVLSTTDAEGVYARPSREAMADAFTWLAGSDVRDTVIVFFSGHGAAHTDATADDYFYLLPSASSFADVRDAKLRSIRTWSGQELASAMARVPALKRLVVLDTCAAGKVDADLSAPRALSSDAIRAHTRSRERTGAWLLAGAAADKVSYEASRFGQGVLTYALLEGMRGPALDDANLLMVSRWLGWAEEQVPTYAAGIGGVQRPVTRRGSADDFPVGQLPPAERSGIPVARVRPVVVSASVVGRGGRQDTLGCTAAVNAVLRDTADQPKATFAYWDSTPISQTWQITGTCTESNGRIKFDGFVTRTGDAGPELEKAVRAQGADVAAVAQEVVRAVTPLVDP